jgi:hypothetical protein
MLIAASTPASTSHHISLYPLAKFVSNPRDLWVTPSTTQRNLLPVKTVTGHYSADLRVTTSTILICLHHVSSFSFVRFRLFRLVKSDGPDQI